MTDDSTLSNNAVLHEEIKGGLMRLKNKTIIIQSHGQLLVQNVGCMFIYLSICCGVSVLARLKLHPTNIPLKGHKTIGESRKLRSKPFPYFSRWVALGILHSFSPPRCINDDHYKILAVTLRCTSIHPGGSSNSTMLGGARWWTSIPVIQRWVVILLLYWG